MIKAIGGYFNIELRKGQHYHEEAIRLNTARNCFEYILLTRKYKKVYIPYYTCEVMLQPLVKLNVSFEFYSINENLEPIEEIHLCIDEAFLYTNYFGLKQDCVERLALVYGTQLIVDNAQAFYAPRLASIDTFYSARKYFGVPDGAYLYTDYKLNIEFERDKSFERMEHLLQRIDEGAEAGYSSFKKNDGALDNVPIKQMSKLTSRILENIDYDHVKIKRVENYKFLHENLMEYNLFEASLRECVPMVYPFFSQNIELKKRLLENKVYVATYWPNVLEWCDEKSLEHIFASRLIMLPIDQRYEIKDLCRILNII